MASTMKDSNAKWRNPFSKVLTRSSEKKKKSHQGGKQSSKTLPNVKDITIVTGVSVNGTSSYRSRKVGLSEKSASDRDVVKILLKDIATRENMDAI